MERKEGGGVEESKRKENDAVGAGIVAAAFISSAVGGCAGKGAGGHRAGVGADEAAGRGQGQVWVPTSPEDSDLVLALRLQVAAPERLGFCL